MEKEELEKLLETNSIQNIARITGISLGSVQYLVIKYGLKSKFNKIGNEDKNKINPQVIPKSSAGGKMLRVNKVKLLPLEEINNKFQNGASWPEICKEYKLYSHFISWMFKNGYLKSVSDEIKQNNMIKRNKGSKHTEETKKRLSIIRKSYLKSHNINCWSNKSSYHTSWLCETIKLELIKLNIVFKEEYMPLKDIGRFFAIDISFPELKIGFEINGRQHYNEKGELLPYYQKRHDLIINNGWQLHEIKYDKCYSNIVNFIVNELNVINAKVDVVGVEPTTSRL